MQGNFTRGVNNYVHHDPNYDISKPPPHMLCIVLDMPLFKTNYATSMACIPEINLNYISWSNIRIVET